MGLAIGTSLGMMFGLAFGVALGLENPAIGMPIGSAIGMAFGTVADVLLKNKDGDNSDDKARQSIQGVAGAGSLAGGLGLGYILARKFG